MGVNVPRVTFSETRRFRTRGGAHRQERTKGIREDHDGSLLRSEEASTLSTLTTKSGNKMVALTDINCLRDLRAREEEGSPRRRGEVPAGRITEV